jgi:hypothetical protein
VGYKMADTELLEKYKGFLRSVELSRETTDKTFEKFKEDYLKANDIKEENKNANV